MNCGEAARHSPQALSTQIGTGIDAMDLSPQAESLVTSDGLPTAYPNACAWQRARPRAPGKSAANTANATAHSAKMTAASTSDTFR